MSEVAVLVLAAGRGTRFGEDPKLLATLRGKPLVRWVAEAAFASSARPIIVVSGHRAGEVAAALADLPLELVPNPSYADGLSTSLRAGFEALPREAAAAIVLLGDMPLVAGPVIDRLAEAWLAAGRPAALVPVTGGRRSNPVVLSRALESDIMALEGDAGAGPLLRRRADVVEYPLEDPALLQDVDTPESLAALEE
ncbi:MAG TPA: nucleotidyltransferase family protein [Microvirga sp.]|nr:nucleotidyltransferase family protein [Microvirga sp.]